MARVSFTLQRPTGGSGLRTDTTRTLLDAAITSATTTLTSATANFYAADVGQQIVITGAGPAAADLDTTIVSVTNATTVEVADAAGTTVSDAIANIISDDVDGLRADGLQVAPGEALSGDDTFFEAFSTCYGEMDIEWALPLVSVISATPEPTQYVVVYSPFGPPETIPSGIVIAEGNSSTFVRQTNLPEGEFAYYTLFVRYQSNGGDDYYERVAQVSEIVPRNFGSTLDMWNRIPEYYQSQDTAQGTLPSADLVKCLGFDNYGDKIGPLLNFIGVFGFEMDRVRSLANHVSRSKDPQHADAVSLDLLAKELGTIIDEEDLGAQRLRSLIDSIGVYRRRKGTELGCQYAIKSITGNDANVNQSTLTLDVNSGRVNFIVDPQNTKSAVDIETTATDEFGEAESPAYLNKGFVSSSKYPVSSVILGQEGQFAVSTPGMESVGTLGLGNGTPTGMTEVIGDDTAYTGSADPDMVIPSGHMYSVNDSESAGTNSYELSLVDEFDLPTSGGAITVGGVCQVSTLTPSADRNVIRLGGSGGNPNLSIYFTSSGRFRARFRDTVSGIQTSTNVYDAALGTIYYVVAHVDASWSTLYFNVYDSSGLVESGTTALTTTTGTFLPSAIIWGEHPGGIEMFHASQGQAAERAWESAADIAAEWTLGTRTPPGGTLYTLDSTVGVVAGDVVSFSVHSGVGVANNLSWARLVDTATGNVIRGYTTIASLRNGVPYFDIPVTAADDCDVQFHVKDNTIFGNSRYLLEKNAQGPYFDGSLVRGGWLIDSTSISDYRWEGTPHNSRSLYSEDYERTRQILSEVYRATLPVSVADLYTITYNNIP